MRHVNIERLYARSPVFFLRHNTRKIERPKTKVEDSIQARHANGLSRIQDVHTVGTDVENVGFWDKIETFVGGIFEEETLSEGGCTGIITDLKSYWKGIDISEAPGESVGVGFIIK
jgi:hypothetical protein